MPENASSEYTIAAVNKALDIIEALAEQDHERSLVEIAAATRMPKSTAFRYLATLEARGYAERILGGSAYRLGARVLRLAGKVAARANVRELALPYMRELRQRYNETVNLAVLSQGYVVYLEILESTQTVRMAAEVGSRDYPHSTALGKAMMAFLPQTDVERIAEITGLPRRTAKTITTVSGLLDELARVREQGYAVDDNENEGEPEVRCIGAPILDAGGRPIAALSISALGERVSLSSLLDMGVTLTSATSRVSRALGYVPSAQEERRSLD